MGSVARKGKKRSGGSIGKDKLCKADNSKQHQEGFTSKAYRSGFVGCESDSQINGLTFPRSLGTEGITVTEEARVTKVRHLHKHVFLSFESIQSSQKSAQLVITSETTLIYK